MRHIPFAHFPVGRTATDRGKTGQPAGTLHAHRSRGQERFSFPSRGSNAEQPIKRPRPPFSCACARSEPLRSCASGSRYARPPLSLQTERRLSLAASARWRAAGTITSRAPASTSVGAPILQSRSDMLNDSSAAKRSAIVVWPVSQMRSITNSRAAGLRLAPEEEMEKLVDKPAVARQRKPLEHPPRDLRADRTDETPPPLHERPAPPAGQDVPPLTPAQSPPQTKHQKPPAPPGQIDRSVELHLAHSRQFRVRPPDGRMAHPNNGHRPAIQMR